MLDHLNHRLGKGVAALAVMLIALLVVQTPVAMVDRALHANGHAHAANAFAGPLAADLQDHDARHDQAAAADADAGSVDGDEDRDSATSHPAHHHHDSSSLLGLVAAPAAVGPWAVADAPWPGSDTSPPGLEASRQKRPPKARLEHVA